MVRCFGWVFEALVAKTVDLGWFLQCGNGEVRRLKSDHAFKPTTEPQQRGLGSLGGILCVGKGVIPPLKCVVTFTMLAGYRGWAREVVRQSVPHNAIHSTE